METININGKIYYAENIKDINADLKIVVLQRGWVLIGYFKNNDGKCTLSSASVIRAWGTKKGLGELAEEGPKENTKLDKCNGIVEFNELTMVLSISALEEKWSGKL